MKRLPCSNIGEGFTPLKDALRLPGIPHAVGTLQPGRTPVFSLALEPRRPRVSKVARAVNWLKNRQLTPLSRLGPSLASSGSDCVSPRQQLEKWRLGVFWSNE